MYNGSKFGTDLGLSEWLGLTSYVKKLLQFMNSIETISNFLLLEMFYLNVDGMRF